MKKTRVAIIGTTGLPARYGGFETLAHHLTRLLSSDYEMTVYCSSKYFAKKHDRPTTFNGARLVYLPFNANGYQSIIYDIISLFHALIYSDVLVVLGISGTILLPFLRMMTNKRIIVNIDGQEWKRAKWNLVARKFLALSERMAVRFAHTVITDNKIMQEYVHEGYGRHDAMLIEYGADHVKPVLPIASEIEEFPFLRGNYAIKVCRVEPENNVHVVLQAFARNPQHQLVVVGLWSHGEYGRAMRAAFGNFSNIHLLDPIYDRETIDMLRSNATMYVHGHSAGGTNPSLVEAMALELPVLAFDISYNRETTGHRAEYFKSAEELSELLHTVTPSTLYLMGKTMKAIADRKYTWQRIAALYADAIEGVQQTPEEIQLTHRLAHQQIELIRIRAEKECVKK